MVHGGLVGIIDFVEVSILVHACVHGSRNDVGLGDVVGLSVCGVAGVEVKALIEVGGLVLFGVVRFEGWIRIMDYCWA